MASSLISSSISNPDQSHDVSKRRKKKKSTSGILSSILMTSNSSSITWGSSEDGHLGIGKNEEKEWAYIVKALEFEQVRSVVVSSRNSLAICKEGS